jgi:hypothetical protein
MLVLAASAALAAPLPLASVAFSADGRYLAVGADGVTVLFDASTRAELGRFTVAPGRNDVSFLPQGWLAITGWSESPRTHLVDPSGTAPAQDLAGIVPCTRWYDSPWGCASATDGMRVDFGGRRLHAQRWDGAALTDAWTFDDPGDAVAVAVEPHGDVVVVGTWGRSLTQTHEEMQCAEVDLGGGQVAHAMMATDAPVEWLDGYVRALSQDGSLRCEGGLPGPTSVAIGGRPIVGAAGGVYTLDGCMPTLHPAHEVPVTSVAAWSQGYASVDGAGVLVWWDADVHETARTVVDGGP